ncbi:MAG: hypothetical protein KDD44_09370 [Bdellovibrionales bacterium]|nr:hypothetical protein [Bdellovibrionales bacterium]
MENGNSTKDVLIVVSKLKNYIKNESGMNTSGNVAPKLSDIIRELCDKAIENAKKDGRKTVMDRDFEASAPAATSHSTEMSSHTHF